MLTGHAILHCQTIFFGAVGKEVFKNILQSISALNCECIGVIGEIEL